MKFNLLFTCKIAMALATLGAITLLACTPPEVLAQPTLSLSKAAMTRSKSLREEEPPEGEYREYREYREYGDYRDYREYGDQERQRRYSYNGSSASNSLIPVTVCGPFLL